MVFDYFACNGWKLFLCFLFFTSCVIKREANQLYNQDLFDSVSREGWSSTSDHWRWEDDVLVGETTEENPLDQSSFFIRSEEHTSELHSRGHLVCRLLLEKKINFINTDLLNSYCVYLIILY